MKTQVHKPKSGVSTAKKGRQKSVNSAGSVGGISRVMTPKESENAPFLALAEEIDNQDTTVQVVSDIVQGDIFQGLGESESLPIETPEIPMVSKYSLEPTDDPNLFRVIDRNGDWIVYFNEKTKQYLWSLTHIIGGGFPMEQGLVNWLKSQSKEDAEKYMEFTGNRGSRVHEAIRDVITGITVEADRPYKSRITGQYEPLTWDEYQALLAWQTWGNIFKPKVRRHECSVSTKQYACTLDFEGAITLPKGRKVYINDKLVTIPQDMEISAILEWKYTSMIRDGHKLQLSAQASAAKIWPQYTGVVRVGTTHKEGFEMRLWDYHHTREVFYPQFRRTLATFLFRNPPYEHDVTEYPASVSLIVPRIEDTIKTPQGEKVE